MLSILPIYSHSTLYNHQQLCTAHGAAVADVGDKDIRDSVYRPFEAKLYDKLADAHPDLPVHILDSLESGSLEMF
jgi:hypothetical protein